MAADPGLHRSGFSEPRKTGAADRSPEASLVKLGRTEEPAAAVHGEDSPGSSAVRWRKLGRSHDDEVVKLGKDSRKVDQMEVVMKLAGVLACQLRGGGEQALWRA